MLTNFCLIALMFQPITTAQRFCVIIRMLIT